MERCCRWSKTAEYRGNGSGGGGMVGKSYWPTFEGMGVF